MTILTNCLRCWWHQWLWPNELCNRCQEAANMEALKDAIKEVREIRHRLAQQQEKP